MIEEFLRFQLSFQADGVQSHVLDIAKLVVHALRVLAQHHVRRLASAADQNVFSVDMESPPAYGIQL